MPNWQKPQNTMAEFEVGEVVEAMRSRNMIGKFSKATVIARAVSRTGAKPNRLGCTVCQLFYLLSCGTCCGEASADSIGEQYKYDVRYRDNGVDMDLEAEYLRKVATTATVVAPEAVAVSVEN